MAPVSSDIIAGLIQAVANTSVLTFLTLSAHWNITGPDFPHLHVLFGEQYEALFDTVDLLAERVRVLGAFVPVNLSGFESMAGMPSLSPLSSARGSVEALVQAHTKNVTDLQGLAVTAKTAGDTVTENMILGLIEGEQKTLWQLRSYLGT